MISLKKIKIGKVKNLAETLAQRATLTFLFLFGLALIIGGLIFFQYSVLAKKKISEFKEKPIKFDEKTYQEILEIWQERQKRFEEAKVKGYPDPFK